MHLRYSISRTARVEDDASILRAIGLTHQTGSTPAFYEGCEILQQNAVFAQHECYFHRNNNQSDQLQFSSDVFFGGLDRRLTSSLSFASERNSASHDRVPCLPGRCVVRLKAREPLPDAMPRSQHLQVEPAILFAHCPRLAAVPGWSLQPLPSLSRSPVSRRLVLPLQHDQRPPAQSMQQELSPIARWQPARRSHVLEIVRNPQDRGLWLGP